MNYKTIMICALLAGTMQSVYAMEDALITVLKTADTNFDGVQALIDVIKKCNKECQDWEQLPAFQDALKDLDAYMKEVNSLTTTTQKVQHSSSARNIAHKFEAAYTARHSKDDNNN